MQTVIQLILSIGLTSLFGFLLYTGVANFIPSKYSEGFFKMVPLYPKPKYAFILYLSSGLLFFVVSKQIFGDQMFSKIAIFTLASSCLIASSQFVKFIAHLKKENVEESMEEEIERKSNQ